MKLLVVLGRQMHRLLGTYQIVCVAVLSLLSYIFLSIYLLNNMGPMND